jgi:transposase
MGAPYSLDLRERVVAAVTRGMSRQEAAERFDVSLSSPTRWMQRAAASGSPDALPMGGKGHLAWPGRPTGYSIQMSLARA